VHRIAVLAEPAAGGSKVIKLEEVRQDRLAGLKGAKPASWLLIRFAPSEIGGLPASVARGCRFHR